MRKTEEKNSVSLEALLRLKRSERPSEDFWDSFEDDFQRRRLNALVEPQVHLLSGWNPVFRALAVVMPVLIVAGVVFLRLETQSERSQDSLTQRIADTSEAVVERPSASSREALSPGWLPDTTAVASQFVMDSIEAESRNRSLNFRKVLYTPAIHLSAPSGAFYVRDNLSSVDFQISTAEMKSGRNF